MADTTFADLPLDILHCIADHLDPHSLGQFSQVTHGIYSTLHKRADQAGLTIAFPSAEEYYAKRFVPGMNGELRVKSFPAHWLPQERFVNAIRLNKKSLVRSYLRIGADPNAYCMFGIRMLNIAIRARNPDMVFLLLDNGADPSLANFSNSARPIDHAVRGFDYLTIDAIVDRLIASGADLSPPGTMASIVRHCSLPTITRAMNRGGDLCQRDLNGTTPLHTIRADERKLCFLLHEAPELLRMLSYRNETALHTVIRMDDEEFAFKLFIKFRSSVRGFLNTQSRSGETVLHLSIIEKMTNLAVELIHAGVVLDMRARYGTELHYAIKRGLPIVVQLLIRKGADVDAYGGGVPVPLFYAVDKGSLEMVKTLVEIGGADLKIPDARGVSILDFAVDVGDPAIVEYLEAKLAVEEGDGGVRGTRRMRTWSRLEV